MVVQINEQDAPIIGVEVKADSSSRDQRQRAIDSQLVENGGFDTVPGARDRTGVNHIDDVEVLHVKEGQVQTPDPNEVTKYDTEGNKKEKNCKEDA